MYNLLNNKTISAALIASVALTTVACGNDKENTASPAHESSLTTAVESFSTTPTTSKKENEKKDNFPAPTRNRISAPSENSVVAPVISTDVNNVEPSTVQTNLPVAGFSPSTNLSSAQENLPEPNGYFVNETATPASSLPLLMARNEGSNFAVSHNESYTEKDVEVNPKNVRVEKDAPNSQEEVTGEEILDNIAESFDSASDVEDNVYIPVPQINDESDFDNVLADWKRSKENAAKNVEDANEALENATRVLDEKETVYQEKVKQRDKAKTSYEVAKKRYEDILEAANSQANTRVAQRHSDLERAQQELDRAKRAESDANTRLIEAKKDAAQIRKDKAQLLTKLEAIDTGIASLDKRIEANEAKKNTLTERKAQTIRDDFTADEYQTLVSQAVIEMINAYRVENGAVPLRTHDVYNYSAQAWSEQMAKDGASEPAYQFGSAFRHSPDSWGSSSENIAGTFSAPKQDMSRENWAALPVELFEMWRDSEGHNENMLRSTSQGVGVGVVVDNAGRVWATTQFFTEDTQFTSGARMDSDKATQHALASGEDFYVSQGAMDILGVDWSAPKGTKGADVNYQYIKDGRGSQEAKLRGLERGVDSKVRVSSAPVSESERVRIDAEVADIDVANAELETKRQDALSQREGVMQEVEQMDRAAKLADSRVKQAESDVAEAAGDVEAAVSEVRRVESEPVQVEEPEVPASYVEAREDAKQAWDAAEVEVADAWQDVEVAQQEVSDALMQKTQADAEFDAVMEQAPVDEVAGEDGAGSVEEDVVSFDDVED
mgnify:FL=1